MFSGCSLKHDTSSVQLPNQESYLDEKNFQNLPLSVEHNLYRRYFAAWEQKGISVKKSDALWGASYAKREMYGVNYQKLDSSWFKAHLDNANFDAFATINAKGITVKNTNMRIFPTDLPLFSNPSSVGEGFPFDYNQNSGIKINTPIMISHFTKDKAWAYIESNFASGFIPSSSLAFVDKEIIDTFKHSDYYLAVKDNINIFHKERHKERIKIGTFFPKNSEGQFLVVQQQEDLQGYLQAVTIPLDALVQEALPITKENIIQLIHELINEPYGWGEAFLNRDCSALTKDYFAAFGVHLSRNSRLQTKNGEYHNLKELSNEAKKNFIKEQGKSFFTLIYLKGHIMLYIGLSAENEPLVFHNLWGIRTKDQAGNEGRKIIGKAVISELDIGKELPSYDEKNSILTKIEGMVIIQ